MENNFVSIDLKNRKAFREERLFGTQIIEQRELPIELEQQIFKDVDADRMDRVLIDIEQFEEKSEDEIWLDLDNTKKDDMNDEN